MSIRYDNAAARQAIEDIDSTLSLAVDDNNNSQNIDVAYGVEEDIYYTYSSNTWTKHENDADNNFCYYKVYTIKGFLAACQVANANVYLMNDLEVYKDKNYRNGVLDSSGSPSGKNIIIHARKITSYAARDNFEDIENINENNICSIYGLKVNQCLCFFDVSSTSNNDKFDKVQYCGLNIYNINFLSSLLSYDDSNEVKFTNAAALNRVRFKNCDISIIFKGRRSYGSIFQESDRYDFCSIFSKYVSLKTNPPSSGTYGCTCLNSEINNSYIHLEGDVVASTGNIIIAKDIHNSTLDLRNINLCKRFTFGGNSTIDCKVLDSTCQNVIINIANPIMDISNSTPLGGIGNSANITLNFTSSGGGVNLIHSDNADFILPDLPNITFTTNTQVVSSNSFKSYPSVDDLRDPDVLLDSNFLPN